MSVARRLAAGVAAGRAVALLVGACGGGGPGPTAPPKPAATAAPSPAEIRLFFVGRGTEPCGGVQPVVRTVVGVRVDARLVLRELLRGPNPAETAAGFTSLFGPPTADALLDVVVTDGIARVSFRDLRPLLPDASSSCGSAALLAALDATLAQVPGVRGAVYSFAGDEAAFYEWLQMAPPD